MTHFSIDKSQVGIIRNKKEWDSINPLYPPNESLAILEFLRTQYINLFNLPTRIDKTVVGIRKPKRKKYAKS